MIHQKWIHGGHWALICHHWEASMMNQAQHPKELLELAIVICPSIVKHTVTRHDQSTRITMADPVSFFRTFSSHFSISQIALIQHGSFNPKQFFTSTFTHPLHTRNAHKCFAAIFNIHIPNTCKIHQFCCFLSHITFLFSCISHNSLHLYRFWLQIPSDSHK